MQYGFQATENTDFNQQINNLVALALQALRSGVVPFTDRAGDRLITRAHDVVRTTNPTIRASQ
ncbi:hypothetical protein D3C76_1850230 [compost metagenome]